MGTAEQKLEQDRVLLKAGVSLTTVAYLVTYSIW